MTTDALETTDTLALLMGRMQGVWRDGVHVIRFEAGMGRWWGFVNGHAFAKPIESLELAGDSAIRFLSGAKRVQARLEGGHLVLAAGGAEYRYEKATLTGEAGMRQVGEA